MLDLGRTFFQSDAFLVMLLLLFHIVDILIAFIYLFLYCNVLMVIILIVMRRGKSRKVVLFYEFTYITFYFSFHY